MKLQKQRQRSSVPPWMVAEKVGFGERVEIMLYKLVSLFPLLATWGIYSYLFVFYVGVSFHHLTLSSSTFIQVWPATSIPTLECPTCGKTQRKEKAHKPEQSLS